MGLFASIAARFGKQQPVKNVQKRRYNAAQMSRLTNGWGAINTSANSDLRMDLDVLRSRSRDLAQNNDYARKFLQMLETNVVGPDGFILRSLSAKPDGSPDQTDRNSIEAGLDEWGTPGNCETSGIYSFADMQRMLIRAIGRDGEALVRRIRNPKYSHGYKQQLLDIDRLDSKYNEELPNGNLVTMGIEYDTFGAPVAYHLLTRHPGDTLRGGTAAAIKRVVAGTTGDAVIQFITGGLEVAGTCCRESGVGKNKVLDVVGEEDVGQRGFEGVDSTFVYGLEHLIVSIADVIHVVAVTTLQIISLTTAIKAVIASRPNQGVLTSSTAQVVITDITGDRIVQRIAGGSNTIGIGQG